MANAAPVMLATPSSLLQARGGFALKNLWVTPHDDAERWPAGDYTIQSKGGEGLPAWTKQVGKRCAQARSGGIWWIQKCHLCWSVVLEGDAGWAALSMYLKHLSKSV